MNDNKITMTIVGFVIFLVLVIIVLSALNKFTWFKKLRGDKPWYIEIWKPIAVLALLQLIRQLFS
jgi:hypothetical protein